MVAKISFELFTAKEFYKVRPSISRVSKNVIYIAFSLNCLKQRVGSTVDWKPTLRNIKSHTKKKKCDLVALLITLLMFEIIDLLLLIN